MEENRQLQTRLRVILFGVLGLTLLFVVLAYLATIANGLDESQATELNTVITSSTVSAARGNITDRYGRVLVTNRTEYNVVLNIRTMGDLDDQIKVVRSLLKLCREQKVEWLDEDLPISKKTPYKFTTDTPFLYQTEDGRWTQTRLGRLCKAMGWPNTSNTQAEKLVAAMKKSFQLDKGYEEREAREMLGVLYACYLRDKEVLYTPCILAEDVDIDLISVIKEKDLPGVEIQPMATREYETDYAAALLGQVGAISAENWEEKKDYYEKNGYTMDATIGLSGVESAFEKYLRGTPGTKKITAANDGKTLTESYPDPPKVGGNVALTLDIKLQEAAEKALAEYVPKINHGNGGGAAVVVDISDGSILAAASYPSYSAVTYNKDYKKLAKNKLKPLYNRALLGTYAPGSTYKMCTATAAINAGTITPDTRYYCDYTMEYLGHKFHCWYKRGHGSDKLSDAVRDSCNIYFYNVGIKTGIEAMTKTAKSYGLGEPSGIELSESTGVNAGPEYAEKLGGTWMPGNVLSAAIGQSDNQFSPLQLANYVATLSNGGSHYQAHLLKTVKNSENNQILYQFKPKVMNRVDMADEAREAILTGMGQVIEADDITAFEKLEDSGVKVGCKTGTAQIGRTGMNNTLFVSFAPFNKPQVAICTVVEKNTGDGAGTAPITAAIMDYYFSKKATQERVDAENHLVS